MAVSVKNVLTVPYRIVGNQKETVTDVTCDSSYEEGGEACTFAQLGLNNVEFTMSNLRNSSELEATPVCAGYYDMTVQKLKLIDGKTAKELAKEKDCSKVVVRVVARGN